MNEKLIFLLTILAKKNNVKFDNEEAQIQLLSHPYYPSINSITDLFSHFNVDNIALEVPINQNSFSQLPDTFLAQIKDENSSDLVVVSKKSNGVFIVYDKKKSKQITLDKFLEIWTGVSLLIEEIEKKSVAESIGINKFKKIFEWGTFMLIYFLFIVSKPNIFQLIHFSFSLIGIYVSYLIVLHELGLHSKVLDKFCSGQNKKTNCNAVLSSKGAFVFGLFKLSDVGLVYFLSLTLGWLLISLNGFQSYSIIILLSSLAIPFTLFSIYYQWLVVKSWCPLCLTVVSLLWLQFGALFLTPFNSQIFNLIDSSYVFFTISLLLITTFWIWLSPLLKKEQQLKKLEIEHLKFKRNFKLFSAALNQQTQLETDILDTNEIVYGYKNAELNILVITNPMCGFCKESHSIVEKILNQDNPDIQVTIRFNVQPNDKDSLGTKIALKLIELYKSKSQEDCLLALSEIYGKIDANTWLQNWGETSDVECITVLEKEKEWCTNNKINFTPAIIINGKEFPKEYDRTDLLYFIDDLIEEQTIVKEEFIEIE